MLSRSQTKTGSLSGGLCERFKLDQVIGKGGSRCQSTRIIIAINYYVHGQVGSYDQKVKDFFKVTKEWNLVFIEPVNIINSVEIQLALITMHDIPPASWLQPTTFQKFDTLFNEMVRRSSSSASLGAQIPNKCLASVNSKYDESGIRTDVCSQGLDGLDGLTWLEPEPVGFVLDRKA